MASQWYVIHTESRAEYLAANALNGDGFDVFFPCVKTVHPRVGHTDTPLFPGYLFLRCDFAKEGWPSFRPGHRVSHLLSFSGVVPSVPEEVISELAQRVEALNGGKGLWRRFRPGEQVHVVSKYFECLAEVVEEAKSPQASAEVLLQFMGRLVHAKVPWEHLRPFQDGPETQRRPPRRTRGRGRWIRDRAPSVVNAGRAG